MQSIPNALFVFVPALLLSSSFASAQGVAASANNLGTPTVVPSSRVVEPFPRLNDTGPEGYVTAWFDANSYAALDDAFDAGGLTELESLPLPGGDAARLILRPIHVWEPGAAAISIEEDGSTTRIEPSVRMFAAYAPGRPSRGFLGITPTMLHGYVNIEGVNYFLSSGTDGAGSFTISHQEVFGEPDVHEHPDEHGETQGWCHYQQLPEDLATAIGTGVRGRHSKSAGSGSGASGGVGGLGGTAAATSAVKGWETSIFIEIDRRARGKFKSAQDAVDYATLLVGAADAIYERDIGMRLLLPNGYVRVSNGISDPWAGFPGGFTKWFDSPSNPLFPVQRGFVNLLTRFGRGSSENGLLCDTSNPAFASSEIKGFFPTPTQHTSTGNWDLYAFGMENGHTFSSQHTQNYFPPIACNDGSGPDQGTLMSYCGFPTLIWQPKQAEVEKIGMRYHDRVQTKMRAFFGRKRCIPLRFIQRGDFDDNGILDMADLSEFDALLLQGFTSQAAEKIFDMNADGSVDAIDRGLLAASLIPAASSSIHNGSGVNCLCYGVVSQPIMGQTWSAVVQDPSGSSSWTLLQVALRPLASPISTIAGEVLIATGGFGGRTMFRSFARAQGSIATHNLFIPYDPSFAGSTVETQALVLPPSGPQFTNAITLSVSTY